MQELILRIMRNYQNRTLRLNDFESVAKEYEQTAKEYSSILKLEYKKADEFNKL